MNSLSWERFKPANASNTSHCETDLLAFGYSCKLYDNDVQAAFVEQGKNLIPWMGDESLLIDRFDVRGYLCSTDLKKYESIAINQEDNYHKLLTKDELILEDCCNQERYYDLNYESDDQKFTNTNQFEFNYDEMNKKNSELICQNSPELVDDFKMPKKLDIPEGIVCPKSMKQHNIIEKTAKFISKQGTQMEIILKTKQSLNSQFDFLNYDSELNPYYKHLVQLFKAGNYQCESQEKSEISSNGESDNEGYLHPSLLGFSKQKNVPVITKFNTKNCSYTKLAQSLKNSLSQIKPEVKVIEAKEVKYDRNSDLANKNNGQLFPAPSPEIETIIDKLASYVAKNGEDFEASVKGRNEARFSFLNPGHIHHSFYIQRKIRYLNEKRKEQASLINDQKISTKKCVKQSNPEIKCLPNAKKQIEENQIEDEMETSIEQVIDGIDSNSSQVKNTSLIEKQQERKRKAALFLNMIKQKQNLQIKNDEKEKKEQSKDLNQISLTLNNHMGTQECGDDGADDAKKVFEIKFKPMHCKSSTNSKYRKKSLSPEENAFDEKCKQSQSSSRKHSRERSEERKNLLSKNRDTNNHHYNERKYSRNSAYDNYGRKRSKSPYGDHSKYSSRKRHSSSCSPEDKQNRDRSRSKSPERSERRRSSQRSPTSRSSSRKHYK